MYKTRKLKNKKYKKNIKSRKIKNNSNKIYDFSKIHPASVLCR